MRIIALLAICLASMTLAAAEPLRPFLDHIAPPRLAQDLTGTWEYCLATDPVAAPTSAAATAWRPVAVPGDHGKLFQGPPDVRKQGRVWFRTRFTLSAEDAARAVDLHCERVNDTCLVVVNGVPVGGTTEAWMPVRVPLGPAVRAGVNELLLGVAEHRAGGAQGHRPMGIPWFHGGFTGLTLPVHIEVHDALWIEEVTIETHLAGGSRLVARATLRNQGPGPAAVVLAGGVGEAFHLAAHPVTVPAGGNVEVRLEAPWAQPRLWWPHDPYLQHLDLALSRDGRALDALRVRFGFRELRVDGPDLLLNGVPFVQRRFSLIPYLRFANLAELDPRLVGPRSQGYNTVRLHLGAMPRIVRRCDEVGMLVNPEAAICQPAGHQVEDDFWPAAERHLDSFVRSMRNSPSVTLWCISNEFGSVYMPGDDKIPAGRRTGAQVDAWQMEQIRRLAVLDPTRLACASGSVGLGGLGSAGPAPALSLHYAWQPWKLGNQLPQTADWLARGLKSWHGVAWNQRKPMLLSEDLFEPYCFKVPHGLSQWAGDAAYDPAGAVDAVRQAYRWFACGNYRARVALWNPWAAEGGPVEVAKQPLLAQLLGEGGGAALMPAFALGWRGHERAFTAGTRSDRTIEVHHRDLLPLAAPAVEVALVASVGAAWTQRLPMALAPGRSTDLRLDLPIPAADGLVTARLRLLDGERELACDEQRWVVLPSTRPRLPAGAVWLGEQAPAGVATAATVSEALAQRPTVLVIACRKLPDREVQELILPAVTRGLHALWLECGDGMRLPPPLHAVPRHDTAHAFIRSPLDPVCRGLAPELLMSWRPAGRVCAEAVPKAELAGWRILLDVGGPDGLSHAALVRRAQGAGTLTVCQLAIVSALAAGEPAAAALLERIAAVPEPQPAARPLLVFCAADSPLATALRRWGIAAPAWQPGAAGVLLADGTASGVEAAVRAHCAVGGTAILHLPDAALAGRLGATLAAAEHRHLGRAGAHRLTEGLSNDDLWWQPEKGYEWLNPGKTTGKPPIVQAVVESAAGVSVALAPAGLAERPLAQGRLVVDLVRWSARHDDQPVRAQRYLRTLLANCGADLGALPPSEYRPLNLAALANIGLAGSEVGVAQPRSGWPGPGANDLRYFPVNATGMDPRLRVPAPREPLPAVMHLAGVPFRTIDRERQPCDAVVPAKDATIDLPATGAVRRLWLAGGAGGWIGDGPQLVTVWRYADGSSAESVAVGGDHLGTVLERTPMKRGVVGWIGPTPQRDDAVVWVWSHDNPHPGRTLAGISLRGITGGVAVVGATVER